MIKKTKRLKKCVTKKRKQKNSLSHTHETRCSIALPLEIFTKLVPSIFCLALIADLIRTRL